MCQQDECGLHGLSQEIDDSMQAAFEHWCSEPQSGTNLEEQSESFIRQIMAWLESEQSQLE